MSRYRPPSEKIITEDVRRALEEDLGPWEGQEGDLSASIVPPSARARAKVLCREDAVVCGLPWAENCFQQLDETGTLKFQAHAEDGDTLRPNDILCEVEGLAQDLLSGERTALNFLQHLSGIATQSRRFAELAKKADPDVRLLDTRKTVPGLRHAQKYAVRCGGCHNHRMGLYDDWLLKENHIAAVGSLAAAVKAARRENQVHRKRRQLPIAVEVENLAELKEAAEAGADIALLDNFSLNEVKQAVSEMKGKIELEYSGNVSEDNLCDIIAAGVDRVSIGALTKHCRAIDFSMLFYAL